MSDSLTAIKVEPHQASDLRLSLVASVNPHAERLPSRPNFLVFSSLISEWVDLMSLMKGALMS